MLEIQTYFDLLTFLQEKKIPYKAKVRNGIISLEFKTEIDSSDWKGIVGSNKPEIK